MGPNPTPGVLLGREEETPRPCDTESKHRVTTGAETAGMDPQAKDHQEVPAAPGAGREAWDTFSLAAFEKEPTLPTP